MANSLDRVIQSCDDLPPLVVRPLAPTHGWISKEIDQEDRKMTVRLTCLLLLTALGCKSPYYADRGAGLGALTGAGVGAIVGDQVGDSLAGAAIGAGVGALAGGATGAALDEISAQNRAEIASQLGRQVRPGAANVGEIVAMTQAGVDPRLITTYIQNSGLSQPLGVEDIIYLHEQGVDTVVIQAMQNPPPPPAPVRVVEQPGPVIIEEHHYGPPVYRPHFRYRHYHRRRPGMTWGFSFSG